MGFYCKKNPAKIKNIADLPYPKEDLKIAIKALTPAYVTKRSDNIVGLLKDRYVRLSEFQEIRQEDKDTIINTSVEFDPKSDQVQLNRF